MSRIVTCSFDNTAILWDAETLAIEGVLKGHTAAVMCAAFSPDGSRVATASSDKTVIIWDASTQQQLGTLKGHTDVARSVAFSLDGTRIATASYDKTTILWDALTMKQVAMLEGHGDSVIDVAFSPDGSRIATASNDETAILWNAHTQQQLGTLNGHTGAVWSVAFSPDGSRIATASTDKTAVVWDAATLKRISQTPKGKGSGGHTDWISCAAFSPNGSRIATASDDCTAILWDAVTMKRIAQTPKGEGSGGHTSGVNRVAFSLDGSRIATASDDNTAIVWDVRTMKPIRMLEGHTDNVKRVAFSQRAPVAQGALVANTHHSSFIPTPAQGVAPAENSAFPAWLLALPITDEVRTRFVDEDIDEQTFLELDKDDLKDLKLPLGTIKKLVKIIDEKKGRMPVAVVPTQTFSQSQVGPYVINKKLAEGGMATISLARDSRNNNMVVLKTFTSVGNPAIEQQAQAMLRQEYALLSSVAHPNVVKVLDLIDGPPTTIVMEYMADGSIDALCGTIKQWTTLRTIITQTLHALQHLHNCNVLHRDLKPHNILRERNEGDGSLCVKLTDFGVSKVYDDLRDIDASQRTDHFRGTSAYAPPEVQMVPHVYTTKSDVFSWACCIGHLATGLRPMQHQNPPPQTGTSMFLPYSVQDLAEVGLCLDAKVIAVLMRCFDLEKNSRPDVHDLFSEF